MKIFQYRQENPDLLKAINKARLIPVKRVIKGKYGSYLAIRWVAPDEVSNSDQRIANPSKAELHAANADRSVGAVMKRMNNMPKEYASPDGLRTYVAKVLQDSGGGHDAMNAVLEAMSENGVDIEARDNVPATWAHNLNKIQDYLTQHSQGGDSAPTHKPETRKKKEQPDSAPRDESKQEPTEQPEPAPKEEKPTKKPARKTKKQINEEVDKALNDTIRGVKIRKKAVHYTTDRVSPETHYAMSTIGEDSIKDSIAAMLSTGNLYIGRSKINPKRVDYVDSITLTHAYMDLPESDTASEFDNDISYDVSLKMKDGTIRSGHVTCTAPPTGDSAEKISVNTPLGKRTVTAKVLNDDRYMMTLTERSGNVIPSHIWEQLTSKNVATTVLQNLPDPDSLLSSEKAELLQTGIIEKIRAYRVNPSIVHHGDLMAEEFNDDSEVDFKVTIRKSDDEWWRSRDIKMSLPLKTLGLASKEEWKHIKAAKEYLAAWKDDHPGQERTTEDDEEIKEAWDKEFPGTKMPGMDYHEGEDEEIPGQQELDLDNPQQWAKTPQKVKGVHVYHKPGEYEHYAWGDDDEPNYDYIDAPHILYPNEESDRFEIEWNLKAKSKKEALSKFYKKFSAALQAQIDAGDDENGVASDMLADISMIPDAVKSGELDIEYKDKYSWFDCENVDGDEWYLDFCRRYPKNQEEPAPAPAPKEEEPEPEPPSKEEEPEPVSVQPDDVAPISEEELKENTPDDGLDPLIDRNSTVNGLRLTNKAVDIVKKELPKNCVIRSVGIFSANPDKESNQVDLVISAQVHNNETGYDYELPVWYPGMIGDAIDYIETPKISQKEARATVKSYMDDTPSGKDMFNRDKEFAKKFRETFDRLSPTVRDHYLYCLSNEDDDGWKHISGLYEIVDYNKNSDSLDYAIEHWDTEQDTSEGYEPTDRFKNVLRVTDFIDHCEMSEDTVTTGWYSGYGISNFLGIDLDSMPKTSKDWDDLVGYEFSNRSFTTSYGTDMDEFMKMSNKDEYDVVFMLPKGTKAAYIAPFAHLQMYDDIDDSWRGDETWIGEKTDFRSPTIIQRNTTFRLLGHKDRKVAIGKGKKSIRRKVLYVQAVAQNAYEHDKHGQPPDDFYSSPYKWWEGEQQ